MAILVVTVLFPKGFEVPMTPPGTSLRCRRAVLSQVFSECFERHLPLRWFGDRWPSILPERPQAAAIGPFLPYSCPRVALGCPISCLSQWMQCLVDVDICWWFQILKLEHVGTWDDLFWRMCGDESTVSQKRGQLVNPMQGPITQGPFSWFSHDFAIISGFQRFRAWLLCSVRFRGLGRCDDGSGLGRAADLQWPS